MICSSLQTSISLVFQESTKMLTKEDNSSLPADILKHYEETFVEKRFQGVDDLQLRYIQQKQFASAADALIILGGRTEFAEKYAELFFNFRHLDVTIYSYDHRGQGLSQRMLSDYNKGYVVSFDDYSEDLKIFIDQVVRRGKHRRLFMLCHSMGGAVTAQFLLKYPGILNGVMFIAPMFGINTSPASPQLTEQIAAMMVKFGGGQRYIFGGRADAWKIEFEGNPLTSDQRRFGRNLKFLDDNPRLELGSPTFNWLKESIAVGREILTKCSASSLDDIPMIVLQGEKDKVVTAAAQNQFSSNIPSCTLYTIEGAKHELLMEVDDKRDKVLTIITDYLKQHSSA